MANINKKYINIKQNILRQKAPLYINRITF